MPEPTDSDSSEKLVGRECSEASCDRQVDDKRRYCDEHGLLREPAEVLRGSGVVGKIEPRLWTPPLRPLTRETTRGFEVIEFADMIGEPLLPWQQWLVKHALELNDDGTYRFRIVLVLVARQNGKSTVKRVVSLWRMYMDGARVILGTAQDVALSREQMNLCKATIYDCPDLRAEYGGERNVNGDEMFWLQGDAPKGTPREALPRYLIRATNRKAGRGLSIDELNIDELRELRDWLAWSAVSKTVMARVNAQIWGMSNMGDDEAVVLNQLRSAAGVSIGSDGVSVLGEARDPSIGIFEWSAPEGCELDDWDAIAQGNPGLNCGGPSSAAILTALHSDPPAVYRSEVLCQKVDALDGAFDTAAWVDCRDATGTLNFLRDRVAVCVDVSPDSAHVSLLAAAVTDSGRPRVEVVTAWNGTEQARAELGGWLEKVQPVAVGWYPGGPGAVFAPILRPTDLEADTTNKNVPAGWKYSREQRRYYVELTGGRVIEACMGFSDLVAARGVLHPADPLLDNHISGASKYDSGDGWRFVRKGVGHVDAAYGAAGAVALAQIMPERARPRIRSIAA